MRKFAISDIHGCRQTFEALLEKIQLTTADELYLLGDYIDRGPDSKGVIDLIWKLQAEGYSIDCLRGNHEEMLLNILDHPTYRNDPGDQDLLASFGVSYAHRIPEKYINWCRQLSYYFAVDQYLLVHAGFDFTEENPLQDKHAMLWIRNWRADIDRQWLNGRTVVHGHTPTPRPAIELYLEVAEATPEVCIDNGCVYHGRHAGLGSLCALELTERKLYFQEYVG